MSDGNMNRNFFNQQKYGEPPNAHDTVNGKPVRQVGPDEVQESIQEPVEPPTDKSIETNDVQETLPPTVPHGAVINKPTSAIPGQGAETNSDFKPVGTKKSRSIILIGLVAICISTMALFIGLFMSSGGCSTSKTNNNVQSRDDAIAYLQQKYDNDRFMWNHDYGSFSTCYYTQDDNKDVSFTIRWDEEKQQYEDNLQGEMFLNELQDKVQGDTPISQAIVYTYIHSYGNTYNKKITMEDFVATANAEAKDNISANTLEITFWGSGSLTDDEIKKVATVLYRRCGIHTYEFKIKYNETKEISHTKTLTVVNGVPSDNIQGE